MIAPPWVVKIELVRGCNLACRFCPIFALPEYSKRREHIALALCQRVCDGVREVAPRSRVELTMRGEPTLHPALLEVLATIRRSLPQVQISVFTNGIRFLKEPWLMLYMIDAGVNILNIDCYGNTYTRFSQMVQGISRAGVRIEDFRQFTAYRRYPSGERLRVINLVPDIAQPHGGGVSVRRIHNNAGNSDPGEMLRRWGIKPLTVPLNKRCARPFRELVFTYDGAVVVCCHDWRAERVLGTVPEHSVAEIWYGESHMAILRSLWDKDRSGPPCAKCNYHGGYRLGLLRDPYAGVD